jgi:hypothetical protein
MINLGQTVRASLLAVALACGTTPLAVADNGGPDVEGGHSHPHGAEIADAKIKAFAAAALKVERISDRYMPKIQSAREAGDEEQMRAHAGRARAEMTAAIRRQRGISVQEYQTIARRAQQDADLATEIRALMRDAGRVEKSN